MKKKLSVCLFLLLGSFLMSDFKAQDLSAVVVDSVLTDTLNSDMAFYIYVTNISGSEQTIFIVRTNNALPADWTSGLCFDACFPPHIDSIVSVPEYGSSPFASNETRRVSIHMFPTTNHGTGYTQIQIATLSNPDQRLTFDFTGTVSITDVNDENNLLTYSLDQNYPNPFNPSTIISYSLAERGNVSIKLYDVLGNEIGNLLNEEKESGNYNLTFDTRKFELSSGVYFYTIRVNDFVQTRKMILEK